MNDTAQELVQVINEAFPKLSKFSDSECTSLLPGRKWSRKHLIGHLIDSAGNNHQRFIRAQLKNHIELPGYTQDEWVRANGYESESWENLLQLWRSFNLHLAHVISRLPKESLSNSIVLDAEPPMTLQYVAEDYVRHLKHHLTQMM